ncbi:MAG TPA: hypothetical protein VGD78_16725 [Chthoniobacterales bacterium]
MPPHRPLTILIAGPFRSGSGDDPVRLSDNLRALEAHALPLWRAGHIPMIGEWVALPLIHAAGGTHIADGVHQDFLYPVARRLIARCDAVLRVPGESKGADQDVRLAREHGLPVYFHVDEVPVAARPHV